VKQLHIQIDQISDSASKARVRAHQVIIDRPQRNGGSDRGPMGGELFLASIAGCFMSNLLAAIRAREAGISGVRIELSADIVDAPTRFSRVEMLVTAAAGNQETLERLVEIADRGCIMMNTLRDKLEINIKAGGHGVTLTRP
jgi:putative redox protein